MKAAKAEVQQKATKAEVQHVYKTLEAEQKETRAEVQHVYRSLAESIEVHSKSAVRSVNARSVLNSQWSCTEAPMVMQVALTGHKQLRQISAEQSRQMQAMAADRRQRSRDAAENLGPFTLTEAARDASPNGSDDMICFLEENGRLEIKDGKQNFTSL